VKYPNFIVPIVEGMGHTKRWTAEFHMWRWKKERIKKKAGKSSELEKGKALSHYVVAHWNIGVNEKKINTSFSS